MKVVKRFFQFFKIDYDKLNSSHTSGLLVVDLFMIILILFNLGWLIFDYSYQYQAFQTLIEKISPPFNQFYGQTVHPNFMLYDMIFVGIFLLELFVRWGLAVYRKTYDRWFFYPFIHWYDVLGCIPLSSFRILRLLRLFSMVYRLHRLGIIDLKSTFIFKQTNKYLGVFTEEISDRVVVNVLSGVQDEIKKGSPVFDKVVKDVLLPKQHIIATWLARRLSVVTIELFAKNEDILKKVIDDSLAAAISNNRDIARLKMIPGAGPLIAKILNESVSDITFNTIKESVYQLSNPQNNAGIINDAGQLFLHSLLDEHEGEDHNLDDIISAISFDVVEIIKEEVKVQQWKIKEEQLKANRENK
jgi:hypothetical protein